MAAAAPRLRPTSDAARRRPPSVPALLAVLGLCFLAGVALGLAPPPPVFSRGWGYERWRELPTTSELVFSLLLILVAYEVYRRAPVSLRWVGVAASVLASFRYIFWRAEHSLSFDGVASGAAGVLLFAAELYALGLLLLGHFQTFWPLHRRTPEVPEGARWPSVDVFITTYNEEAAIVRRTAVGCLALHYPGEKKVWILDDGRRAEIRALAQEVGCRYLTRPDNEHAKAGNLNHALQWSDGELIAQFDADHVPVRSFLLETVPFFLHDEELALVQTPHHFYNPDVFQRNLVLGRAVANEQDLFFHVLQPGNDRWNAAFFCGSNALLRRRALEQVGGFATETVTEDAHTSVRLHAAGWRSAYLDRILAGGLAAETFPDAVAQRLRWGRGMVTILRVDNPLFRRGLRLPQRLCYTASSYFFFFGWPRIVYLLAPILFLVFGVKSIDAGILKVATFYLPHFLAGVLVASAVSRNYRHTFWSEVYETAVAFWMGLGTTWSLLSRRRLPFQVTPKGGVQEGLRFHLRLALPQLVLLGLTAVALGRGFSLLRGGPESSGVVTMNLLWGSYNLLLLAAAVLTAFDRPQLRGDPRLPVRLPVQAAWLLGEQRFSVEGAAVDLSETGARVLTKAPLPAGAPLELTVGSGPERVLLRADLVWSGDEREPPYAASLRFLKLGTPERHRLIRLMYGDPGRWEDGQRPAGAEGAFARLAATLPRWLRFRERARRRRSHRFVAGKPAVLAAEGARIMAQVEDLSESGALLRLPRGAGAGAETAVLELRLSSGHLQRVPARIVGPRRGGRVAVEFDGMPREARAELLWDLYAAPLLSRDRTGSGGGTSAAPGAGSSQG